MADSSRKLIVLAAGVGTRSGDTRHVFAGFRGFMAAAGFAPSDFVEATYAGTYEAGRWVRPADYDLSAFEAPLVTSIANCAEALWHEAQRRPPDAEWHLVGFSFGGVVLLEAAISLQRRAPDAWGHRLRTITTLSSPLNGCSLGDLRWLGDLFGPGAVSRELCALGDDPRHRQRLAAEVAALRAAGVTVTTLAEADDAIVQPADAIVGPVEPALVVECASSPSASVVARHLGHGRIVNEPFVWERLLALIGPQSAPAGERIGAAPGTAPPLVPRPTPPPSDAVLLTPPPARATRPLVTPPPRDEALLDQQLAALKARLRAEGRL
ncbi:MAG TPA: hypothetical protein VK066_17480 [Chloroflexota bacterium]|nr:hypothetical protein [Chloroflexota bacterium]